MITSDWSDAAFDALRAEASSLQCNPLHLLNVMMSESGCKAAAHNPNGHASGLIQFMPDTLKRLGFRSDVVDGATRGAAFRQLSAEEQMSYVGLYFRPYVGFLLSPAACYVATFLPAFVKEAGHPNYVLCAKNGPLGWAYEANSVFDADKNYAITVQELADAIRRNCRGARWEELCRRLAQTGDIVTQPEPAALDLRSTLGLQQALLSAGCDPGALDGIPGRLTRMAVLQFQQKHELVVDGIPGPLTRAALQKALDGLHA